MAMDDAATTLLVLNRIGLTLGVGSATLLAILFAGLFQNTPITAERYGAIQITSKVANTGLAILWLSGPWFRGALRLIDVAVPPSPKIWASLIIVWVVSVNAVVLNTVLLPIIKRNIGIALRHHIARPHRALMSFTAVVAVVSWYSSLILGATPVFDDADGASMILLFYGCIVALGVVIGERLLDTATRKGRNKPRLYRRYFGKALSGHRLIRVMVRMFEVRGDHPILGMYGRTTLHSIRLRQAQRWPIAGGALAVTVLAVSIVQYPEVLNIPSTIGSAPRPARGHVATVTGDAERMASGRAESKILRLEMHMRTTKHDRTSASASAAGAVQSASSYYLQLARRADHAGLTEIAEIYRCRARIELQDALRMPESEAASKANLRVLLRRAQLSDACRNADRGRFATAGWK